MNVRAWWTTAWRRAHPRRSWRPCEYCGKWQTGRLCRRDRRRLREARIALGVELDGSLLPWRLIRRIKSDNTVGVFFPCMALIFEVLGALVALAVLCLLRFS